MTGVTLHSVPTVGPLALWIIVTIAALGAAALLGVAFAAFVRRRSRPYLLLVAAFAALFGRSILVPMTEMGMLSPSSHHLAEHAIDVVLVALVVAAVYYARSVSPEVPAS